MDVKLAGLENKATTSEGQKYRQPVVSMDKEEDTSSDSHPAPHHQNRWCSGVVALSPGPKVEQLERLRECKWSYNDIDVPERELGLKAETFCPSGCHCQPCMRCEPSVQVQYSHHGLDGEVRIWTKLCVPVHGYFFPNSRSSRGDPFLTNAYKSVW